MMRVREPKRAACAAVSEGRSARVEALGRVCAALASKHFLAHDMRHLLVVWAGVRRRSGPGLPS